MGKQGFVSKHWSDDNGAPEGGHTCGTGFTIAWQRGPLGRIGTDERVQPNGAFVEDVLAAVIDRVNVYQDSRFACDENAEALKHLQLAAEALDSRTKRREAAKTEGTHEGN